MNKNNNIRFLLIIVIVIMIVQGSTMTTFGMSLNNKHTSSIQFSPNSIISNYFDNSDISKILKPEDEGDHFPCGYELWCYHASLTLENGEQWDSAATFVYFMNKTFGRYREGLSWLRIRHWNRETNDYYDYFQYDEYPGTFNTTKDMVNISYYKSNMTGLYPDYHFYCEDPKYSIISDLSLHAISYPCWLFNQTTNKRLPWGFTGWGKVYFIPLMEVNGKITKNGRTYNATGYAYFEHDFLYVDFADPFSIHSPDEFLMCSFLTMKSAKWLLTESLKNRLIEEPLSLHRSNDYLFGWCWSWVVFDNNWNMVIFRPAILGMSSGRVPVFLYFTKDQKTYFEIGNIYWNNNKEKYVSQADIYIPDDFEIAAYRDDIEFKLSFTSTSDMTELFSEDVSPGNKRKSCTFYTCGDVEGYYIDEENNLRLNGIFAIEQSRWLSRYDRHRSIDLELLIPPNGFGISIKKVSHWLLLEKFFKFQLKPNFDFTFYIRKSPE